MKRCLVEVNVWLALLVIQHRHHHVARQWFDRLGTGEAGLCRMVHLALMRLLSSPSVMGSTAIAPGVAFELVATVLEDERLVQLAEPSGLDNTFKEIMKRPLPGEKGLSDAYLAAFALAGGTRLVTFDRGYAQFQGLEVEALR